MPREVQQAAVPQKTHRRAVVPLKGCSSNAVKVSWIPGLSAFGVWAPVPGCVVFVGASGALFCRLVPLASLVVWALSLWALSSGHCFFLVFFFGDQPRVEQALRGGQTAKKGRRPEKRFFRQVPLLRTEYIRLVRYDSAIGHGVLGTYFWSLSLLFVFPTSSAHAFPCVPVEWSVQGSRLPRSWNVLEDGGSDAHYRSLSGLMSVLRRASLSLAILLRHHIRRYFSLHVCLWLLPGCGFAHGQVYVSFDVSLVTCKPMTCGLATNSIRQLIWMLHTLCDRNHLDHDQHYVGDKSRNFLSAVALGASLLRRREIGMDWSRKTRSQILSRLRASTRTRLCLRYR